MAAAELLEELKSMRLDLTGQITKLSDDLKDFQRNTNERLQKIESVMFKVDEIDGLKTKQQQLEADVDNMKESLNFVSSNAEEVDNLRESNDDLKKRLEHLERYSRDYNIRVLGVNEDEGEDCMTIILDFITSLGFEDAAAEVENAHRTGKKRDDKPRPIIAKLYSRPFKKRLSQAAKSADGKEILQGVRIVKRCVSLRENFLLKEERFLSLSLVSALLTLYFVKWQYDEIFFFPHLRAQRKNHLRDVFMSAGITCAVLHKSEF